MSDAEEIDALILHILLNSEHGRSWLKRRGEKAVMERGLMRLVEDGLDRTIASQLWVAGDSEMVKEVSAMTAEQIASVNREWRRREAATSP